MPEDSGRDSGPEKNASLRPLHPVAGKLLHLGDHGKMGADRILHEVRSYWNGLRDGRAVPCRADVDPRGMRRALDHAFILERIAPGAARIRLAGRHLVDLMGMEVRGMPICALLSTTSRGRFSDVLESTFKAPQIAEMTLCSQAAYGRPELQGKMLLLPLRSDLGDVTRALGCIVAEGTLGIAPRRFDMTADAVFPVIRGAQVLDPSPSANGLTGRPQDAKLPAATRSNPAASAPLTEPGPEERRARFRVISNEPQTWSPPHRM
ncbi:PAS domain-containing protein [Paracoccus ravus]|uniref:PAS domain-containing protein n=1 Tax=Paracoccus ravus TaxID=2447760 RepID=UPI00106EDAA9|nr:PAS domain-containing protein [Paracoccus ravus]